MADTQTTTADSSPTQPARTERLSHVQGPCEPPLSTQKVGELVDQQAQRHGDRTAVAFPWQNHSLTFQQLSENSKVLAKAYLEAGLKHGDCVGIMAGNCYQYIEAFLGAARIGCPFVVFQSTLTPRELCGAVALSTCKILMIAPSIGAKSLTPHIEAVCTEPLPDLKRVVFLGSKPQGLEVVRETLAYSVFFGNGHSIFVNTATLRRAERKVKNDDILNLQFTSGTTGLPKAAMLTHFNLINNGHLFAEACRITLNDVVCCPPPLFHCFGLVMGFLGGFTHGSTVVFPCDQFDAQLVVKAMAQFNCTVLFGVPTMFLGVLEANKNATQAIKPPRLALVAGASSVPELVQDLRRRMGFSKIMIAYGMTETSPVTFVTPYDDAPELQATTVGKVMPHTAAKIIDASGQTVPRGVRGELCTSGFALQKGYWQNEEKTAEVMKVHDDGIRWIHTGDECVLTDDGHCLVTGRIKDLIIRGGENISPVEVEARLVEHASIEEASVVAIKDHKYGEVVGCFLRLAQGSPKPSLTEIRSWVRQNLGGHKAPQYVFWIGDASVGPDYPKTASGKHQKHILREIGNRLAASSPPKAKL